MTRNATLADLKAAIAADTGVDAEQQQLDNTPEYLMLEGDTTWVTSSMVRPMQRCAATVTRPDPVAS